MDRPGQDLTSVHVRRATDGDAASRAFLVERFSPLLLAQARYRLAGARHCEPEDLVQEVWSIALPRLPDLASREGRWTPVLVKFLATTLLRCANHALRRQAAGRGRDPAGSGVVDQLPAELSGVITRLARQQRIDAVHAAIRQLGDEEQEVLVLRGIEQHSNREVAAMLGVDDASVTRRWQKALAHLRAALPDSVLAELE